jgi:hypothetical protein
MHARGRGRVVSLCPACGATFRKGRRRGLLLPSGELTTRLVCPPCAARALSIVPVQRPALCRSCSPPSAAREATVCAGCAGAEADRAYASAVAPFVERLRGLAKAYRLNGDPRAGGLEMAAEILRSDPGAPRSSLVVSGTALDASGNPTRVLMCLGCKAVQDKQLDACPDHPGVLSP